MRRLPIGPFFRLERQVEHAEFGNIGSSKQTPDGYEARIVIRPADPTRSSRYLEIGQHASISSFDHGQVVRSPSIMLQDSQLCAVVSRLNPRKYKGERQILQRDAILLTAIINIGEYNVAMGLDGMHKQVGAGYNPGLIGKGVRQIGGKMGLGQ